MNMQRRLSVHSRFALRFCQKALRGLSDYAFLSRCYAIMRIFSPTGKY